MWLFFLLRTKIKISAEFDWRRPYLSTSSPSRRSRSTEFLRLYYPNIHLRSGTWCDIICVSASDDQERIEETSFVHSTSLLLQHTSQQLIKETSFAHSTFFLLSSMLEHTSQSTIWSTSSSRSSTDGCTWWPNMVELLVYCVHITHPLLLDVDLFWVFFFYYVGILIAKFMQ